MNKLILMLAVGVLCSACSSHFSWQCSFGAEVQSELADDLMEG